VIPASYILGIMAVLLVIQIVVHRLEKRLAWPYSELQAQPQLDDPTGYGAARTAAAVENGFVFLGWARDIKGETYRVNYAMLVSPDRTTFAVIGAGTILKLRLQAIWLHTPAADGRSFYTTDTQSGVQIDLSRNWTNQLVSELTFDRVWQRHLSWIQERKVLPRGFRSGREVEDFRAVREEHYRSMERAGLIRYTDASATWFRFTLYGSMATATWSYIVGLLRAVTNGKFPKSI
jgi:hypothetical protein